MKKRMTIEVFGLVQGVSLRWMTEQTARRLGLTGFASNTARGSVAIVAEGEEERLRQLLRWLRSSPGQSRVDRVAVTWENEHGSWTDFSTQ